MVFPVLGWATMSPRWPLPMGAIRSIARMDSSSAVVSSVNRSWGLTAVRLSKPEVAAAGGGTRGGPGRREWRDRLLNWTAHSGNPLDRIGRRTGPAHTRAGVLPGWLHPGVRSSLTQNADF